MNRGEENARLLAEFPVSAAILKLVAEWHNGHSQYCLGRNCKCGYPERMKDTMSAIDNLIGAVVREGWAG